jgi:hypothetical protein
MPNANRRCTCCKEYGPATDGIKTIAGWFLDSSHILAYSKRKQEKQRAKQQRADKVRFKEKVRNFRMNDIKHQHELTQSVVNKLCNLLDKYLPCISCNRPWEAGHKRNASHYKSRAANSAERYSLLNLHGACIVCNLHLSGNLEGYRKGLVERYGEWLPVYLDNAPRSKQWRSEELQGIRKTVNAEIKRLESGLGPSRNWRLSPLSSKGEI